jgi:hypothetical protein
MSGQIEVGKWAVEFRGNPCCGYFNPRGSTLWSLPFVVTEISVMPEGFYCDGCGRASTGLPAAFGVAGNADWMHLLYSIKRLPDLEDPIEETRELELTR